MRIRPLTIVGWGRSSLRLRSTYTRNGRLLRQMLWRRRSSEAQQSRMIVLETVNSLSYAYMYIADCRFETYVQILITNHWPKREWELPNEARAYATLLFMLSRCSYGCRRVGKSRCLRGLILGLRTSRGTKRLAGGSHSRMVTEDEQGYLKILNFAIGIVLGVQNWVQLYPTRSNQTCQRWYDSKITVRAMINTTAEHWWTDELQLGTRSFSRSKPRTVIRGKGVTIDLWEPWL